MASVMSREMASRARNMHSGFQVQLHGERWKQQQWSVAYAPLGATKHKPKSSHDK